ncbi:lytic murein transglycosylase [Krasilnikovia sp. MM14-A1259]|uniref:lytic transglycosylase domain-containing protein n=1 Tax=Krasilnikovia sp. MM14-A1259 TaxID=3373539 RepID=UPI0038235B49
MGDGQDSQSGTPEVRPPAPHGSEPIGSAAEVPSGAAHEPLVANNSPQPGSDVRNPDKNPTPADDSETETAKPGKTRGTETGAAKPGTTETGDIEPDAAKSGGTETGDTRPASASTAAAAAAAAASIDGEQKGGPGDPPTAAGGTTAPNRRATRLLRHANPIPVARAAGRRTSAWAKRPSGRLILPAIIAVLLMGAAGSAGAYLVPKSLPRAASPSTDPGFPIDQAGPLPSGSVPGRPGGPNFPGGTGPSGPAGPGARPADALAGWAQQVGTRVGIPVVAVQAYGYAELVVARTTPSCHLNWTTLAAIADVESAHGSAHGAVLGVDGSVQPPIYGLPLDGKGGRQLIRDTDQGVIDGDATYDRAVGPLQFIPSTWKENAVDADNSGLADPNDIDDAALTAAVYLCRNGRDMSKADAWWDAILSYNAVRPYAQKVFDAANTYGQRSRA